MKLIERGARALARAQSYRRRFGWRATLQRVLLEWRRRRAGQPPVPGLVPVPVPMPLPVPAATPDAAAPASAQHMIEPLATLRTYLLPRHDRRRVTVVTDSIAKGSLFGGVGTAIILGTLLANRRGADLRIVTRAEPPVPSNVDQLLRLYGIELQRESQFRFVPRDDLSQEVDLMHDEIVMSTSWWTTAAVLPSVPPAQIVYLLQEDERMFYPFGDDRLRCEQILRRRDIRFVINCKLLYEHFLREGFDHFADRALSFEPAFPTQVFHPRPRDAGAKKRLVFYARPKNPRNLFFLGLEVLTTAVAKGWLPADQWEIVFVGRDIPDLDLGFGQRPVRLENLNWADYADLVGRTDVGLSLMYTPHPSYPPLDMAASGAVVVTNRHGTKQDLAHLSPNLICCEPTAAALVDGLRRAIDLAAAAPRGADVPLGLARDWRESLHGVVESLAGAR